jgi:hypothetical protein
VQVSPSTTTHPPSDHRAVSIQLYTTTTPPPSLDSILPAAMLHSVQQRYNVSALHDLDTATQYVDVISNAYDTQWQHTYIITPPSSTSSIQHTLAQMTAHLQTILHAAATASIGHAAVTTGSSTHQRSRKLIATVVHQYNRYRQCKTAASHRRYMRAQDGLRAYVQRMADNKYSKLRDDIAGAVSTFQHESSVWWRLIERATRPPKVQQMKAHQQQLLAPHTVLDAGFDSKWFTHVEQCMSGHYHTLALQSSHPMLPRVTLADIQAAVKQLQNSKHPGHDNILNEMLKYGGEALQHMLLQLFNGYMQHQYTSAELWYAQIMMLQKNNGDANDLNNYRGISFISTIAKLYESILYKRLLHHVQPLLHVQQAGFTQQRGCPENIFTLTECASFRYYHQNKSTYILFCDLAKAYDSVWRNGLYYKMINEYSIPPHFVNIIMQIYSSVQCCILYEGTTSTTFTPYRGLLQGSVLSPLLFNLYINELVGILHNNLTGVMYGYTCQWTNRHDVDIDIAPYKVATTFFADDFTTVNADAKGVDHSLTLIYAYCTKWRLTLNCNKGKTEVLVMYCMPSDEKHQQWQLPNGHIVHRTKQYTYLGVQLHEHATAEQYIDKRLQASHNAMGKLYSAHVLGCNASLECRVALYNAVVLPILNYGSEVMTYGSTTSFEKLTDIIDKRHHVYVKQLLHCRSNGAPINWFLAETV